MSQWCCSANCGYPLHALTYNWTRVMQLANTPPLQSTAPRLHPVSFHQTSPLVRGNKHSITAYYLVHRPRKDERLSRPAWLVTYRNKVLGLHVPVQFVDDRLQSPRVCMSNSKCVVRIVKLSCVGHTVRYCRSGPRFLIKLVS